MVAPKATLVSWTADPEETLFVLWKQSRGQDPLLTVEKVKQGKINPPFAIEVRKTFEDIVTSALPILENINLVWVIEDMPIFLREQIVRHRIGTVYPGHVGADTIPDIASSTWWSQSSRYIDVGDFVFNERFYTPESIRKNRDSMERYIAALRTIEETYNKLVKDGVPLEDARGLIPLCMTHRMSWGMNLQTLNHIAGNRGCWLAQAGIWEPLIRSMMDEIATKIDLIFRRFIDPPCFKQGKWAGCPYRIENQARVTGADEHPPCPLYLTHHHDDAVKAAGGLDLQGNKWVPITNTKQWIAPNAAKQESMEKRCEQYGKLWGRDPVTGELTDANAGRTQRREA